MDSLWSPKPKWDKKTMDALPGGSLMNDRARGWLSAEEQMKQWFDVKATAGQMAPEERQEGWPPRQTHR